MMLPKIYKPGPGFQEAYSTIEMVETILSPINEYLQNKTIFCPCDCDESSFVIWLKENTNSNIINVGDKDVNGEESREIMKTVDLVITDPPFAKEVFDPFIEFMKSNNIKFLMLGPYKINYCDDMVSEYKCQEDIFWKHKLVTGEPHKVRGRMYTNDKEIMKYSLKTY